MRFRDIFKSNYEDYHRASPAKATMRFITCLIDFFILTAVSLCLYFATYEITTSLDGYKDAVAKVKEEVDYYNEYIKETHLVEYYENVDGEEERCDAEEVAIKILLRSLKYSYNHTVGDDFSEEYDVPEKLKEYEETTLQNDNILYFLSEYLPAKNIDNKIIDLQGKSPQEYYKFAIQKASGDDFYKEKFTSLGENEICYIRPYIANKIIGFLYYNTESSEGQTFYNDILNTYIRILTDLENVMLFQEDYQAEHYIPYNDAIRLQATYIVVSLIINLIISYGIAIVLPQLLFKDGRTIARRIFNIGLINKNLGPIPWWKLLIRNIVGFFGQFLSLYLIPILPIFNFDYYSFNVPFIPIGDSGISLGWLILIFGCIVVVNAITVPILRRKTSLLDLATGVYVVDGHHLDEMEIDTPHYEGQ